MSKMRQFIEAGALASMLTLAGDNQTHQGRETEPPHTDKSVTPGNQKDQLPAADPYPGIHVVKEMQAMFKEGQAKQDAADKDLTIVESPDNEKIPLNEKERLAVQELKQLYLDDDSLSTDYFLQEDLRYGKRSPLRYMLGKKGRQGRGCNILINKQGMYTIPTDPHYPSEPAQTFKTSHELNKAILKLIKKNNP